MPASPCSSQGSRASISSHLMGTFSKATARGVDINKKCRLLHEIAIDGSYSWHSNGKFLFKPSQSERASNEKCQPILRAPCHAFQYRSRREPELEGVFWGHLNNLESKDKGERSISEKWIKPRAVWVDDLQDPHHMVKAAWLEV
jgi:hypothetical protein